MIRQIVTHPGGAHKDDVLACCVLAALHNAPIARREPTIEELADPAVAIVDIGGQHAPELNNFDHHHFDRDHPPTCALSLVLQKLGLYEDARHFCDWLPTAEWFDSRGPNKTAAWLEVPRQAISQLNSPIDMTLLRRFARTETLLPDAPLYSFMVMVGSDLLEYLRIARERLDFVSQHAQRWTIDSGAEKIEAVFLPRTDPLADEPSTMVGSYVRAHALTEIVAVTVYPDRRGEGYGLSRYEDHPRLDFSRVQDQADVHFAHKSGFMCKTSATCRDRLRELISLAWIDLGPGE
jgi:hypothetical protein